MSTKLNQTPKQKVFRDMVLGILIYAVVLGFFEEYTNILTTWSYSVTFFVAIVMQLLTFATFYLKSLVVKRFKDKEGGKHKAILIFLVWLILFLSKFVFLGAINTIFGDSAQFSGFIGLMLVILTMEAVRILINKGYEKLG